MSSLLQGCGTLHGGVSPSEIRTTRDVAPAAAIPSSKAAADLEAKLERLTTMDGDDLRWGWRRLYRSNPPRRITRGLMAPAIAWKLQEQVYGGLSAAVRRRIAKLGNELEAKDGGRQSPAIRLKPGAKLVREWGGESHVVLVTDDGFEWQGRSYRSLSVLAREITGTRWSGPRFFGLAKQPKSVTQADELANA
jgi:hypothetical protein